MEKTLSGLRTRTSPVGPHTRLKTWALAPSLWNALPDDIKSAGSVDAFDKEEAQTSLIKFNIYLLSVSFIVTFFLSLYAFVLLRSSLCDLLRERCSIK